MLCGCCVMGNVIKHLFGKGFWNIALRTDHLPGPRMYGKPTVRVTWLSVQIAK